MSPWWTLHTSLRLMLTVICLALGVLCAAWQVSVVWLACVAIPVVGLTLQFIYVHVAKQSKNSIVALQYADNKWFFVTRAGEVRLADAVACYPFFLGMVLCTRAHHIWIAQDALTPAQWSALWVAVHADAQ